MPASGAIEGETGFACAGNGDCHLIVVERAQKRLYEMWRANITGPSVAEFRAGCVAVWDLVQAVRRRRCAERAARPPTRAAFR